MVTITIERRPARLRGERHWRRRVATVVHSAVALAGAAVKPHKASLSRLADIPLTVLGVAAADFAAFHIAHGWGWLATGVSLVVLEHLIADEQ